MFDQHQADRVKELILQVGEYIRNERIHFDISNVEHKDIHDMVSYVDKNSEDQLIRGLEAILPDASFRGEETGNQVGRSDYTWIIDPLDGTTNFIHNIPHYCISVGLQLNEIIIAGWVYEIYNHELYYAQLDGGAYMNGHKISVSKTVELHQCLLGTGFPVRTYDQLSGYLQLLKWVIENTRGVRRLGTAAYDLCLVASGKYDAFYEPALNAWDVAGGVIIVQEAGGKVTDFKGGNNFIDGKSILVTNGHIHEYMLKAINDNLD